METSFYSRFKKNMYSIFEPVPIFWDPYVRRRFVKLGVINGGSLFHGNKLCVVCPVDPSQPKSNRPWCLPVIADDCDQIGVMQVRDLMATVNGLRMRIRSSTRLMCGEVYQNAVAYLDRWHSDQRDHMTREFMDMLIKKNAARTIQRRWRHVIADPSHAACKRRLLSEFQALSQVTAW